MRRSHHANDELKHAYGVERIGGAQDQQRSIKISLVSQLAALALAASPGQAIQHEEINT